MATKVEMWQDSQGRNWSTREEADQADACEALRKWFDNFIGGNAFPMLQFVDTLRKDADFHDLMYELILSIPMPAREAPRPVPAPPVAPEDDDFPRF